jgi:hypothetical protein
MEEPEDFCGNATYLRTTKVGNKIYRCNGHTGEAKGDVVMPVIRVREGGSSSSRAPGGDVPVAPGVEVVEQADVEEEEVQAHSVPEVTDWWEPVISQNAWVRFHTKPRLALYVPVDGDPNGPKLDTLSKTRITHFTFADGTLSVKRDQWDQAEPQRVKGQKWTGETWFFLEGHVPAEAPSKRRNVY